MRIDVQRLHAEVNDIDDALLVFVIDSLLLLLVILVFNDFLFFIGILIVKNRFYHLINAVLEVYCEALQLSRREESTFKRDEIICYDLNQKIDNLAVFKPNGFMEMGVFD